MTAINPPMAHITGALHVLRAMLGPVLFVAGVALVWKTLILLLKIPPFVMPPPEEALRALLQNGGTITAATFFTLRNAMAGLVVAFLVAVTLAATFVAFPTLSVALLPIVIVMRTAPVLAIAPMLIMVFGRGVGVAVAVVVIVSFFPIMVNAMRGFGSTPRTAVELMHVLGAGWLKTFVKVRLPFSLPYIFAGLRSAATSAILSAMLADWLSGAPGLGKLILDASSFRKTGLLWAGVIVSMAIAYGVFSLSALLERTSKLHERASEIENS